MLILTCPNCGPRNVSEFRHGGEVNPRPKVPGAVSDEAWADYLFMRKNTLGVQTEWWYHRAGCGRWFLAERHTLTNEVARTWVWTPTSPISQPFPPPERAGEGEQHPAAGEGESRKPASDRSVKDGN